MLFSRVILSMALTAAAMPVLAQKGRALRAGPNQQKVDPFALTPNHLRLYTECMHLARSEPLKALPMAEKWKAEGGGLGARHCVAIAMFEGGKFVPAATQLEAIERDMGSDRPGVRAELLAQAGQAWMEANQAENAAAAQSRALDLKPTDVELWVDRGLSFAAMRAWPRAISDFDRALRIEPDKVEILVLARGSVAQRRRSGQGAGRCRSCAEARAGPFRGAARARLRLAGAWRPQSGQRRIHQGSEGRRRRARTRPSGPSWACAASSPAAEAPPAASRPAKGPSKP